MFKIRMETRREEYDRLTKYLDNYLTGKFDECYEIIDEVSHRVSELEKELKQYGDTDYKYCTENFII